MNAPHDTRVADLQRRMADDGLDLCVFFDADSIYYFSGFANYLAMDFGRATLLAVARDAAPVLITPGLEAEMGQAMTRLADVRAWQDGVDDEWRKPLRTIIAGNAVRTIGYERDKTHPAVGRELAAAAMDADAGLQDVTDLVGAMRMVKTPDELATMRQAGEVAVAMVKGGRAALGEGVPEYEVALAIIAAGTRKAAEFLSGEGDDVFVSPTIYNLQVLQSGHHTCMVHRRSSARRLQKGDPIYMCFCGIANFKHFKLGFDREFWIGSVTDEQARAYETITAAQRAALAEIRPGAIAEDVNAASEQVYLDAGYGPAYRTGRAVGYSFLEKPELKKGDKTPLQAGMTFAVDGGVGVAGRFGARIGDSIAVTAQGFEYLTDYPRELTVI
jgi:Xaa-Pro aminopeptidase